MQQWDEVAAQAATAENTHFQYWPRPPIILEYIISSQRPDLAERSWFVRWNTHSCTAFFYVCVTVVSLQIQGRHLKRWSQIEDYKFSSCRSHVHVDMFQRKLNIDLGKDKWWYSNESKAISNKCKHPWAPSSEILYDLQHRVRAKKVEYSKDCHSYHIVLHYHVSFKSWTKQEEVFIHTQLQYSSSLSRSFFSCLSRRRIRKTSAAVTSPDNDPTRPKTVATVKVMIGSIEFMTWI